MASAFCWGCKSFKDIHYTEEETGRDFCQACVATLPPSSEEMARLFLLLTIPYKIGDRVEGRTGAQIYDGIGTVREIDISLAHGGTPVQPTFRVELDEKAYPECPDEIWYTECCLTRANVEVRSA